MTHKFYKNSDNSVLSISDYEEKLELNPELENDLVKDNWIEITKYEAANMGMIVDEVVLITGSVV